VGRHRLREGERMEEGYFVGGCANEGPEMTPPNIIPLSIIYKIYDPI
jgi:hypothetical protein